MIKAYLASARGEPLVGVATWPNSGDVVGVDLLNGTPREIPKVEKATGLRVPSLASLSEIQHSSRMRHEGDLLILSLPMPRETADATTLVPIGFLLRPDILLTVRFGIEVIFDDFALGWAKGLPLDTSALSVLTGLFEVTVDSVADRLEEIGANLDIMAGKILTGTPNTTEKGGGSNIKDKPLRELLREIGHTGQLLGEPFDRWPDCSLC
jgi:magnesium transporter